MNQYRVKTISFVKFRDTGCYGQVEKNYTVSCNSFSEAFATAMQDEGVVEVNITRMG